MQITFKGTVDFKGNIETPIENKPDFTKRELWLTIDQETEWPQTVNIEFIKDKCSIIEKYKVGDEIEVDVNMRGNKSKDGKRCFNSLNGWRVRGIAGDQPPVANDSPPVAETAPPAGEGDKGPDDLPF